MKLRRVALIGVSIFVVPASAWAQLVLSGDTGDEPYIVCKTSPMSSDTYYASETVPNNPQASSRFRYHAEKYGEQIGERMWMDCEAYERMTPEYDATWRPGSYKNSDGKTITVEKASFLPDGWDTTPTPDEKKKVVAADRAKNTASSSDTATQPSPAETAAEAAAKRRAEYEAEFQKKQAEYERQLAEQQRQVEAYKQAQDEIARKKEEQRAAAERALANHKSEMAAHAETIRQHDAQVAQYERDVAAQKLLKNFDERHKLGKASTDTDANRCVTTAQTKLNDTFKGNTAASIVNGCGQPVDVRICLMTAKGWNCGTDYGVASQARASHSSFEATGQVFVDARVSGSSRALSSPN